MLDNADLEHHKVALDNDVLMASAISIVVSHTAAASAAFASVLVAWIGSHASRKVVITANDNRAFHAEDYTLVELQEIMALARRLEVFDIKPMKFSDLDAGD